MCSKAVEMVFIGFIVYHCNYYINEIKSMKKLHSSVIFSTILLYIYNQRRN